MPYTGKYCPDTPCRWTSYNTYRLLLLMYFLNESSIAKAPADIAHSTFLVHIAIYILTLVFVGIPLTYSEICIAQYTNCSFISMWNFFPLFRGFGYGMMYCMVLRTMYINCLTAWYLVYTFYSALDPPPWTDCNYFKNEDKTFSSCMVKKYNATTFQHVLEVYTHSQVALQIYTASYWFFEKIIGANNTYEYPKTCCFQLRAIGAALSINALILILAIKKEKYLQLAVKFTMFYVGTVILILLIVGLTHEGSWDLTVFNVDWHLIRFSSILGVMSNALLTMGSGTGMVVFLSRDVPFRSPATMTSIVISLYGSSITLSFALVLFSGLQSMVYYHGGELRVLEHGSSLIFQEFGSTSEILSYFSFGEIWSFFWFSSIFCCLFINLWIAYVYINDLVFANFKVTKTYNHFFRCIITGIIILLAWPFLCADLFEALVQATHVIQLITIFCFSMSLYWIYGYENHSVDITFMIGVKASLYWKTAWAINPIFLLLFIYQKTTDMECFNDTRALYRNVINDDAWTVYWVVLYTLIAIYLLVVIFGTIVELFTYDYFRIDKFNVISKKWGPKDVLLNKSRKMFIPQVMTTEFLYRQVRIKNQRVERKLMMMTKHDSEENASVESSKEMAFSTLTSN